MTTTELLEKIKAEIERRMKGNPNYPAYKELESLLSFVSTLQVDDVPKDMEEAGKDVIRQAHAYNRKFCIPDIHFDDVQLMDIFRAGVYWMAEHDHNRKEVEPESPDEAAEKYENERLSDYGYKGEIAGAFEAGAEWMAEQGVSWEDELGWYDGLLLFSQDERQNLAGTNFNDGDKVIVQIRKKEESK